MDICRDCWGPDRILQQRVKGPWNHHLLVDLNVDRHNRVKGLQAQQVKWKWYIAETATQYAEKASPEGLSWTPFRVGGEHLARARHRCPWTLKEGNHTARCCTSQTAFTGSVTDSRAFQSPLSSKQLHATGPCLEWVSVSEVSVADFPTPASLISPACKHCTSEQPHPVISLLSCTTTVLHTSLRSRLLSACRGAASPTRQ